MSDSACYPWWHKVFAPLADEGWTKTIIQSGCGSAGSDGNVPCSPEQARAASTAWLAKNAPQVLVQIGGSISLSMYTLARYLHSEVGSGTVEERVAVAESAVNRSRGMRNGVLDLLLYRQPVGHPNRGYYGPIHGIGTGTDTAPYGRWAATSRDPSIMSLLLAHLVISGTSGNFSRGADDQDGPDAWVSKGQTALTNYVKGLASRGKYWVGPLPGVNHWHTFLQFTPDPLQRVMAGNKLMQRGIAALQLPMQKPSWPSDLPICGKPNAVAAFFQRNNGAGFFMAALGLTAGAFAANWTARRYLRSPHER